MQTPAETIEHRIVTTDGETHWQRWTNRALFNDQGDVIAYQSIGEDITERKRAEKERELLIAQLQDKTSEQERFVYTVSHDLKSPLVTITGFLGLIEKDFADGKHAEFNANIAIISKAAKRMKQLLDELLELSRIGTRKNPPETINLGHLVKKALENLSGQVSDVGAMVSIEPDMPDVTVDVQNYLHVFENLIGNAVKFSSSAKGGALIKIGVRREEGNLACYVQDNGIGIEPLYAGKIFDLFEKIDQNSDGTGVGLAIVKRVIEGHGGKIRVESEGPGCGATFFFTLPEAKG